MFGLIVPRKNAEPGGPSYKVPPHGGHDPAQRVMAAAMPHSANVPPDRVIQAETGGKPLGPGYPDRAADPG